jgi:TIR domain-containing protein/uncharacterized protein DUF4328
LSGRVFISHASEDRDVAEAVCDAIEARGVRCWIAPRDITPGQDYAEALYEAIVECRALVLVLSERSVASQQVLREVEQALRDSDPIIPFRIDDAQLPPGLQFRIGKADWLAGSTVDLSSQIGMLADRMQAQFGSGVFAGLNVPTSAAPRSWLGYPGVLRRLTATWMTVFLWIFVGIAVFDIIGNLDALANSQLGRSLFHEEDTVQRVAALSAIELIAMFPAIFLWLAWLCGAYLTLEPVVSGAFRFPAGRIPGRFLWPGTGFEGGASLLRELWNVSGDVASPPATSGDSVAEAPRWLWFWWGLLIAMVPLTLTTTIIANQDELADTVIVSLGLGTDLLWLAAAVLGLRFLKPVEKRLRGVDAELPSQQRQASQESRESRESMKLA